MALIVIFRQKELKTADEIHNQKVRNIHQSVKVPVEMVIWNKKTKKMVYDVYLNSYVT